MSKLRLKEIEAAEVVLGPARLTFNDALERLGGKGIPGTGKRNRHPSAIGVTVATMAPALALEGKAVPDEGADQLACGKGAKAGIVDHTVTVTTGSSDTVTASRGSSGIGVPSSRSSSTIISITSWMWRTAFSFVSPQVAAPYLSRAGE